MDIKFWSVLILAGVAYGLLVGRVATRLGRSRLVWVLAGFVAGPLALPILLFTGPKPGRLGLVRRWIIVAAVLSGTLVGAACGVWLLVGRHPVRPSKVVRQAGRPDGPTAFAMASVANLVLALIGGAMGAATGLVVAPGLAVAAEQALRKARPDTGLGEHAGEIGDFTD
jgi:hypothetical protein